MMHDLYPGFQCTEISGRIFPAINGYVDEVQNKLDFTSLIQIVDEKYLCFASFSHNFRNA